MENAAKALEIAGGVLIGLMVLGLLVYGYNHLASVKQTEQSVTSEEQATEFNKNYETYNKAGLYGSQILSLANKIKDYNKTESDKKGYEAMELIVNFSKLNDTNQFFKKSKYSENKNNHELTENYENLIAAIEQKANQKIKGNDPSTGEGVYKTYKEWYSMSSKDLYLVFKDSNQYQNSYIVALKPYSSLIDEQNSIARAKFGEPTITTDKANARITKMEYTQSD